MNSKEKKENNINKKIKKVNEKKIKKQTEIKNSYYQSIGILLSMLVIFFATAFFFYKSYFDYQPPAKFIVLNEDYTVLEEKSLKEDIMSEGQMNNLVNEMIEDVFSYHYLNIDKHGVKIKKYFANRYAYEQFMEAFNSLRVQDKIRANKGIMVPEMTSSPLKLKSSQLYKNVYLTYTFTGVYLLKIHTVDGVEMIKRNISVLLSRQKLTNSQYGLGIETIIIE